MKMSLKGLFCAVSIAVAGVGFADIAFTNTTDKVVWWYNNKREITKVEVLNGCENLITPSVLGKSPVTGIADSAFKGLKTIKSVKVQATNGINYRIGDYAFDSCVGLTNVVLSSGLSRIGNYAFLYCTRLSELRIPDTVTSIGERAFDNCLHLESLTIGAGIKSVPKGMCNYCKGLLSITIPNTVTNIGEWAFAHCTSLKTLSVPSSVTEIGQRAFYTCENLESVSISGAITSIPDEMCGFCDRLSDISIPNTVTTIGFGAFSGCHDLVSFTFPEKVTCIGEHAFYDSGLTSVTIPDSVTELGEGVFAECEHLTRVTLSSGLKSVPASTFEGCDQLSNVKIKPGVTKICDRAFHRCFSLQKVAIPFGVTEIGEYAFCRCTFLNSVEIPDSVSLIGEHAFEDCWALSNVDLGIGVEDIRADAFNGCKSLEKLEIPASVTKLGERVLDNCSSLEQLIYGGDDIYMLAATEGCIGIDRIYWPENSMCYYFGNDADVDWADRFIYARSIVTKVENGVRWWARFVEGGVAIEHVSEVDGSLESICVPSVLDGSSVVAIDSGVFADLGSITKIQLPRTVNLIADGAFDNCPDLETIEVLGSSVSVGEGAIRNCPSLKSVMFRRKLVQWGSGNFSGCPMDMKVHVSGSWNGPKEYLSDRAVVSDVGGATTGVADVKLTVTNVVVHYVLNSVRPEIAVPVAGGTGLVNVITEVNGGAVAVPDEWKANYAGFETMYGVDFGKALMMKSGKKDAAGNDMFVWQDFVAGTDPTDKDSRFTASITFVDGVPMISWSPELPPEQAAKRSYKTYGKVKITDSDWTDVTGLTGAEQSAYNFFKVSVEMN